MPHRNWKDVRAERISTPEAEERVAAIKRKFGLSSARTALRRCGNFGDERLVLG